MRKIWKIKKLLEEEITRIKLYKVKKMTMIERIEEILRLLVEH
jgi:hypothetical protein